MREGLCRSPPSAALVATTCSPRPRPRTRRSRPGCGRTLEKMTLEEKVGQLVVPGLNGVYTPLDSDAAEKLERLARERHVGGFHVFGGSEALPPVLLNPVYGTSGGRATKGDPLAIAVLLNRLQRASALPLLFTADFEGGAGYIVEGATRLPRAMAIGATRDEGLAERAGRLAAGEGRALGVHVDFYPVVDVNNNPTNPIINVRSFGEDPAFVGRMATALPEGDPGRAGCWRTAKHFPGHGDTATDTHLDLAVIEHPRSRLDAVELVPFRAVIEAGHRRRHVHPHPPPRARPDRGPAGHAQPADPHRACCARSCGFDGLVFTDSMSMHAISRRFPPEKAAAMAIGGRGRRRPRPARPRGRAARHPRGRRARRDPARPGRPLGRPHPAGEGAAGPPPRPDGGRRGGAGRARGARPPGRGGGDRVEGDHPPEGRPRPGAAAAAGRRAGAAPVDDRLRERLARGGAGPGADTRAEEALRRRRPRSRSPTARPRPRWTCCGRSPAGRTRWWPRPTCGSPPTAGAWASRRRRSTLLEQAGGRRGEAVRGGGVRQPVRGRHRPEGAGRPPDLRARRTRRRRRRRARSAARRRSAASCPSPCPASSPRATASSAPPSLPACPIASSGPK